VIVGGRAIGPHDKPYVIAEAGVNHNGSVDTALQLVDVAAECGADAVKFQMFHVEELVTQGAATATYQRSACGEKTQYDLLSGLSLSFEQFEAVRAHCRSRSIDFLATPFGPTALNELRLLEPVAIKLGSGDLTNLPLMDAARATELPLIVSVGASLPSEIDEAIERMLKRGSAGRFIVLHCISSYPAPPATLNLKAIASLQSRYNVPIGFSDHSESIETGAWAVAAGACVVEKHITLSRDAEGPDHRASLDGDLFRQYVRRIRAVEAALGTGEVGMTAIEKDVRSAARRSVVADVDIPAGTRLAESMLALKRPGAGICPVDLPKVVDRVATTDIKRDTAITWDMIR
jgi:sialic acid synthase SpsE